MDAQCLGCGRTFSRKTGRHTFCTPACRERHRGRDPLGGGATARHINGYERQSQLPSSRGERCAPAVASRSRRERTGISTTPMARGTVISAPHMPAAIGQRLSVTAGRACGGHGAGLRTLPRGRWSWGRRSDGTVGGSRSERRAPDTLTWTQGTGCRFRFSSGEECSSEPPCTALVIWRVAGGAIHSRCGFERGLLGKAARSGRCEPMTLRSVYTCRAARQPY